LKGLAMKYAIIVDAKGEMLGHAERAGQTWHGIVDGHHLEAWRGNLTTVSKELCEHVRRVILMSEPIWRMGVVIA